MEVRPVALGKNFRLPTDCKPLRYSAHLAPDLEKGTFEGRMELEIRLRAPRREIHLHGIGLEVSRARARIQDRALKAAVGADAESETLTLSFDEDLPPGNAMLDEHAFKARWNLQLVGLPEGLAAISNGQVVKDQKEPGGGRTVQFAETPPLSSYLVAICIGDLASSPEQKVRAYPVRTWAVPQKQGLTAFGQEVASAVLPLLEDYFAQPYAYGKVDQVGVPDFEAGAMENAACITYREVALLLDPKTAPLNVQKRVAEVITHELSHQWFGNLVTMVWWDDLWLNEAFATWMAYKIVDQWRPQWRVWMDFEAGKGVTPSAPRSTTPRKPARASTPSPTRRAAPSSA